MITAILLAGGRSRRSGRRHKACRRLPGERRTWLDHQIDGLRAAGIGRIVLVLGHRPRRVLGCLHRRVVATHNPLPRLGSFASLQTGLNALQGDALVLPLDTPLPNAADLRRLVGALHGFEAVIPIGRDGRGGHPVLLSRRFAHRLLQLDPTDVDARLDRQLRTLTPERRRRLHIGVASTHDNLNTELAWRDHLQRRTRI